MSACKAEIRFRWRDYQWSTQYVRCLGEPITGYLRRAYTFTVVIYWECGMQVQCNRLAGSFFRRIVMTQRNGGTNWCRLGLTYWLCSSGGDNSRNLKWLNCWNPSLHLIQAVYNHRTAHFLQKIYEEGTTTEIGIFRLNSSGRVQARFCVQMFEISLVPKSWFCHWCTLVSVACTFEIL